MIYTKRGDGGKTSLINRKGVLKSERIIWAIGEIDELNSYLGVIRASLGKRKLDTKLKLIQKNLFGIASILAGEKRELEKYQLKDLEEEIDKLESILPVQTKFIFFSGSRIASMLFFARAIARRLERRLVGLKKRELKDKMILRYLNRLSDYLFILARYENFKAGFKEEFWESKR